MQARGTSVHSPRGVHGARLPPLTAPALPPGHPRARCCPRPLLPRPQELLLFCQRLKPPQKQHRLGTAAPAQQADLPSGCHDWIFNP